MDLQELIDREQIRDLLTRYTRIVDTATTPDDLQRLHEVFTPDAVLDYSPAGGPEAATVDEAIAFIAHLLGFERWTHLIGQVEFDFTGPGPSGAQECRVTAYFNNPMMAKSRSGGETWLAVGGYYHHVVVRTPSGWRSRYLRDDIVWTA